MKNLILKILFIGILFNLYAYAYEAASIKVYWVIAQAIQQSAADAFLP